MLKRREILFVLVVISVGCLVQKTSAIGLNEVLDIINVAKDVVVTIAKAWNIVDQHIDFSDIPIPLLDKTESKLFGKIGIINAKLDTLGAQVDAVDTYAKKSTPKNFTTLATHENKKNNTYLLQRKVGDNLRKYYRLIHDNINRVKDLVAKTKFRILGTTTIATILQSLPDRIRLELRINDLLDYITRMDVHYRHFQNYVKDQKDIEQLTLEDFAKYVVSHDSSSIVNLVERIHTFIVPNGRGITNTGLIKLLSKSLKMGEGTVEVLDVVWTVGYDFSLPSTKS